MPKQPTAYLLTAIVAAAAFNCSDTTAPAEVVTRYSLPLYVCLDLESGASRECTSVHQQPEIMSGEDFFLPCCAQGWPGVFHNTSEAQIAHLPGRGFAGVRLADTTGAPWSSQLLSEPFDTTRTVLVRTGAGNVYKLGNPVRFGTIDSTRFDTARLN